ncbi:MAG: D-alanine--D-alanine ligase [Undibacterium sp.]
MPKRIRVALLFGGKSAEHEVSLQSARSVLAVLDRKKYEPVLIGIDPSGRWLLLDEAKFSSSPFHSTGRPVALLPESGGTLALFDSKKPEPPIEVVFPILHGTFGEDGTVQGLLKLARIPFIGADVLGSAVGMDKDVMKRLLRDAGIPIARFMTLRKGQIISYAEVARKLGRVVFVKPANLGSSIGVTKVKNAAAFKRAIAEAFRYDVKILIEACIPGREIECAVLGNQSPLASIPGEVVPHGEFYSYEAKYLDPAGAALIIPAKLSQSATKRVQALALRTFQVLECAGLARVDFFLTKTGKLYVNEINTLPGFTRISMYPKLFEASGIEYAALIDRLIQFAFERFTERERLETKRL